MHKGFQLWLFILFSFLFQGCKAPGTAATKRKDAFNFFVLGDWGVKGGPLQLSVAHEMLVQAAIYHPDMVITVGDNFYEDGVKDLQDEHWQRSYEQVYGMLTRFVPWYVSLGNHDYRGSIQAQQDYHQVNDHWNLPSPFYTYVITTPDHQKVRFIVLDTNPFITTYYDDDRYKNAMAKQDTATQVKWLDSVLSQAREPWKIVYGHHPLFSAKNDLKEAGVLRRTFQPLFDKYHVQAYICGHDHLMQYNRPFGSMVAYIVSGGGGKLSEKVIKQNFTLYNGSIPGFTVGSIKGNSLTFHFIDTTGKDVYHFSLLK